MRFQLGFSTTPHLDHAMTVEVFVAGGSDWPGNGCSELRYAGHCSHDAEMLMVELQNKR
jgi:hypothetical protein